MEGEPLQQEKPRPNARIAIENSLNPKDGRIKEKQVLGRTTDKLKLPSRYGFISAGSVEIVKLLRDEVPKTPLVVMTQRDFKENSEQVRTFEFTYLALDDKGNLVEVGYDKEGKRKEPVFICPWQQREHTADQLGIIQLKNLPLIIDTEKVAEEFLTGINNDSYMPPTPVAKIEPIKIEEHEPEATAPVVSKTSKRKGPEQRQAA